MESHACCEGMNDTVEITHAARYSLMKCRARKGPVSKKESHRSCECYLSCVSSAYHFQGGQYFGLVELALGGYVGLMYVVGAIRLGKLKAWMMERLNLSNLSEYSLMRLGDSKFLGQSLLISYTSQ